ncbi:amino acid ABC transporter permease [Mesorhizobium sp. M1005]
MTLLVSISGLLIGMIIGLIIALLRLSSNKLVGALGLLFVNFFQSTPLLVLLLWTYFAVPILIGRSMPALVAGIGVMSLFSGAYLSEAFRAGILGVSKGQWEAARAMGMRDTSVLRRVILPQALVRVLPPITSIWVSTIKESSLISAISLEELMYKSMSLAAYSLRPVETFTVCAVIYFSIIYPFILLADYLYRRLQRRRRQLA